jgi:hypothetical protein
MSACENLPQELIIAIVDNIRDDKKSLKAFSLVCRAWTNPARDHLFATLIVDHDSIFRLNSAGFTSTYTPFLRRLRINYFGDQDGSWRDAESNSSVQIA